MNTLTREATMTERDDPTPEFRQYILVGHQRYINGKSDDGHHFKGMALHTKGRYGWEDVKNPSTHFSAEFSRFLDAGIKETQNAPDALEAAARYVRVEGAILWLESAQPDLVKALRFYQTPLRFRTQRVDLFAGEMNLQVEGLRNYRNRAINRLWWRLGGVW